jgi:hypothetical protein
VTTTQEQFDELHEAFGDLGRAVLRTRLGRGYVRLAERVLRRLTGWLTAAQLRARREPPRRFCLWGARRDYVQVGSSEDALIQTMRELAANYRRTLEAAGVALTPVVQAIGDVAAHVAAEVSALAGARR